MAGALLCGRRSRTRGLPILWILHLSYGWVVVHLALRGLAAFGLDLALLATHALTVGAIGGLTLGMMTRRRAATRRARCRAGRAELVAYVLVQAAAVVRVLVPLLCPAPYAASIGLSALLWSAAFAVVHRELLPDPFPPRLDGRPG